ncbi:hypothetical protein [Vibrio owensii]|uniref:Uncharacterized protein n=1 Tax=Vibrio owensii CAIM 1854 = LMG 25443 TaxID=1229493 RepID=A0A0C1Z291_9VIBR|nr:hypothetical protein [Vibrio owensii]KIF46866.1 hypothetical protein H735_28485 [Vibrio owensii CAIM 1854 = LMG 25443]
MVLLDKERKNWDPKVDEDAQEMVTQYQAVQNEVSAWRLNYGQYTSTFVLRHVDREVLQEVTEFVVSVLNNTLGLTCRVESLNVTPMLSPLKRST